MSSAVSVVLNSSRTEVQKEPAISVAEIMRRNPDVANTVSRQTVNRVRLDAGLFESRAEGTSVAVGNRNEREIKGILGQGQFVEANHLILTFFFDLNKIQTFIISYKI